MPGYRRGAGSPTSGRPQATAGGARPGPPVSAPPERGPAPRRSEPPRRAPSRPLDEAGVETRLATLCSEAFSLILELRQADELPPAAHLDPEISALLERIARSAANAGVPAADVEHARYALVAFLDETLLGHSSPQKDEWLARPLQMRLFGENTAGEGFFARLEQLRRGRSRSSALEVYYLCLALGFEGRYRLAPGGELARLCEELRRELAADEPQGALSPHGERPDAAAAPTRRRIPLYAIAGAVVALVIVVLVVLAYSTGQAAGKQGARIRELGAALEAGER
jgi:type VI secretion system protein ImpK